MTGRTGWNVRIQIHSLFVAIVPKKKRDVSQSEKLGKDTSSWFIQIAGQAVAVPPVMDHEEHVVIPEPEEYPERLARIPEFRLNKISHSLSELNPATP